MNRRSPLWRLIAVLFVAVIGLAACSDDDKSASDAGDDTTEDATSDPYGGGSGDDSGDDTTDDTADSGGDDTTDDTADSGGGGEASKGNLAISGFTFGKARADAGSEVTVANLDSATHTVTADNGEFDSGDIKGNGTGTFTAPAEAGEYAFHCEIHPSMEGTLTVA